MRGGWGGRLSARAQGCAVVVSTGSVTTVLKKTKETKQHDYVKSLCFFGAIDLFPDSLYEYFCYISLNLKLNVYRLHVFNVNKGEGQPIADLIRQRRDVLQKQQEALMAKSRDANPFAASSPDREVPTGRLFNMQIHRADLKPKEVIGEGEFGSVYLATQAMRRDPYTGKLFAIDGLLKRHMEECKKKGMAAKHERVDVVDVVRAVKMLKGGATPALKTEFLREAEITLMFTHENLVAIEGVAVQQAPWLIALEYAEYGDLRTVLKSCKQKLITLNDREKLHLCIGLARGMEHMASKRVIHMDLAARILLLAKGNVVKVADFGLAREMLPGKDLWELRDQSLKLAIKWLAPEVLTKRRFSEFSDVWSAGITMWEILTYGELPYPGVSNVDTQKTVVKGGRMDKPDGCGVNLWGCITTTWATKPEDRGRFSDLAYNLDNLIKRCKDDLRDLGAILTDPKIEAEARARSESAAASRAAKAAEAKEARKAASTAAEATRSLWFRPLVPKTEAEAIVLASPLGSFLIREEIPDEKLLLVFNEHGVATSFVIRVEAADDRKIFHFGGRPHGSLSQIVGNLQSSAFKGKGDKPLQLTTPATGKGGAGGGARPGSESDSGGEDI